MYSFWFSGTMLAVHLEEVRSLLSAPKPALSLKSASLGCQAQQPVFQVDDTQSFGPHRCPGYQKGNE